MGSFPWQILTRERSSADERRKYDQHELEKLDFNGMIADGRLKEWEYEEYHNGDIYDEQPSKYEQEWEIDSFVFTP